MERARDSDLPPVNPGYALGRIAKALTTSHEHADPEIRERARQKVAKWVQTLQGMIEGSIAVGSRTPVSGVPKWATLEVMTGGFATGGLLAGGSLHEHERKLLEELSLPLDGNERRGLNGYFLSDEGLAQLQFALTSGCYEVDVPEEGALLVVAWLLDHGHADTAREVLDEIGPFLERLRFYPRTVQQPRRFGSRVFLQDAAAMVKSFSRIQPNPRILAQKEAIEIWTPLYDRTVNLFLETVEGDPPRLAAPTTQSTSADGIFGGWPCQKYPTDWDARAQQLLDEYADKRRVHQLCKKSERRKENFFQLRQFLDRCVHDRQTLRSAEIGRIRLLLARCISRRGTPGSSQCAEVRRRQEQQVRGPTFHQIAQVVAARLETYPSDSGIDDLEPVLQPIAEKEVRQFQLPGAADVPDSIRRKVERCRAGTAEELIKRGVISSGDTLASVLPQVTSGLRAAGISDPALRQLDAAIYRAFRRRRSLLLLNLESQVKIDELPWVAAIEPFRRHDLSARELGRETLQEITAVTLISFPQAIIPNKLLQEMRALAKQATLDLPLVEELAADIFMGTFSARFASAAKRAGQLLGGSLYAAYYDIDYAAIGKLPEGKAERASWFGGRSASDPFADLCRLRAGVAASGWSVAANGMMIEQQQILTTQNLAVLIMGLDLVRELGSRFQELAQRAFAWICRRLQMKPPTWHAHLIALKNSAYAWRQMIFYLALLPEDQIGRFLAWADEHLARQRAEFQLRFRPAILGLHRAAAGQTPDDGAEARRFLGWSKDRHWLLGPKPDGEAAV